MAVEPKGKGGRPPGALNKRTVARINLLREDLTPVDMMLEAAYECRAAARRVKISDAERDEYDEGMPATDHLSTKERQKVQRRFNNLASRIVNQRKLQAAAIDYAEKAAPYVHQKLASIEMKQDPDNPLSTGFNDIMNTLAQVAALKAASATKK